MLRQSERGSEPTDAVELEPHHLGCCLHEGNGLL